MKYVLLYFSLLSLTTTTFAAPLETHLICGYTGQPNNLSVEFAGPRFVDFVNFGITEEEIQELLYDKEKGLEAYAGQIKGFMHMGSCRRGTINTLVSCQSPEVYGLSFAFNQIEKLSDDFSQRISYDRHLKIKDMSLVVTDVDGMAHLDVKMKFSHFTAEDVDLHISRVLGQIDNGPGSCRFTTSKNQF